MPLFEMPRCSLSSSGLSCGALRWSAFCGVLLLGPLATGCNWTGSGQNANGVRLYQQGQYQAALQHFQQAAATDPTNPDAFYNLGATYQQIARQTGNQADLQMAENYFSQCLQRQSDHVSCRRALAVLLVQRQRTDEAVQMLQSWAVASPNNPAPRVELARLAQEQGQRDYARNYLVEAIRIDPSNSRALTALGRLYEDEGNPQQALANYERSLAANQLQPELSARVASLRTAMNLPPMSAPASTWTPQTRTVGNPLPTIR